MTADVFVLNIKAPQLGAGTQLLLWKVLVARWDSGDTARAGRAGWHQGLRTGWRAQSCLRILLPGEAELEAGQPLGSGKAFRAQQLFIGAGAAGKGTRGARPGQAFRPPLGPQRWCQELPLLPQHEISPRNSSQHCPPWADSTGSSSGGRMGPALPVPRPWGRAEGGSRRGSTGLLLWFCVSSSGSPGEAKVGLDGSRGVNQPGSAAPGAGAVPRGVQHQQHLRPRVTRVTHWGHSQHKIPVHAHPTPSAEPGAGIGQKAAPFSSAGPQQSLPKRSGPLWPPPRAGPVPAGLQRGAGSKCPKAWSSDTQADEIP